MPTYGAYETVTEFSRGAICSVYSARRAGGGEVLFAVKVCQPDTDIAGVEQARRVVGLFQEQVDAQKRLAGLPGTAWAPVHEAGPVEGGAYFVTDYCTRSSIDRLVTGRVRLEPRALAGVIGGVLTGIKQIRDFLRRPHGNIRATNVLVVGEAGAEEMRILLIDPAPQSQLKGRSDVGGDLKALGELLYRLVTHQEYHERSGWPIGESPDWRRLGGVAAGERWRALCNRLLDPNPGSPPTVEEIEQTLLNLAASGGKGKGKLIAVGAGALVVVAGAVFMLIPKSKQNGGGGGEVVIVSPEDWKKTVDEYDAWFAAFADEARKFDSTRADALAKRAPELKDWLQGVREGAGKSDPWSIAHEPKGTSLPDLKNNPTKWVVAEEGARTTRDLLALMTSIRSTLKSDTWSLGAEAKSDASKWRALGWTEPADQIDAALAAVKPEGALLQQLSALVGTLDKADQIEKTRGVADAQAARIEEEGKKLGGDKVLGAFRAWAAAYPGTYAKSAGVPGKLLEALATGVEKVRDSGAALVGFLDSPERKQVCFDELAKSEFYASFSDPTPDKFVDWASVAKGNRYANPGANEDPRLGKDLVAPLTKLGTELEKLKTNKIEPPPKTLQTLAALGEGLKTGASAGADVRAQLTAAGQRAAALQGLAWDCRTKREIEGVKYDVALQQIDEIARTWRGENARLEKDRGAELARLQGLDSPVRDSDAIKAWWGAQRTEVMKDPDETSRFTRALDLEARLVALDGGLARWTLPATASPSGWARVVERSAAQQRDLFLGDFLKGKGAAAAWSEGDEKALGERFKQWTGALEKVVASCQAAEELMDQGYGLDETPPPPAGAPAGTKTVAALAAEVTGPVYDQVKDALAPVLLRVRALEEVAAATGAATLVPRVLEDPSNRPALTLAAWRKLGTLTSAWPASADDLQKETKDFRAPLRAVLNNPALASRKAALTAEIGTERLRRWESFTRAAATPGDVELALDPVRTLTELEIDPAKATDPMVRYRLAIQDLKHAVGTAGMTDEQAKAAVDRFVAAVPGDLAGGAAAQLVTDVRGIVGDVETGPPKIDPCTLGPASLAADKFTCAVVQEGAAGSVLRFTRGKLNLDFVRVEPGPGVSEAFFLGADEVSLGQFIDIVEMAQNAGWTAIRELLPTAEDPHLGPRPWTLRAGKVQLAQDWIQMSRQYVGTGPGKTPPYAPEVTRAATDGRMKPALNDPMVCVSPGAAVYVASLVGCRLPAPGEWALAARAGEAAEGKVNLRDQTWKAQLDYVKATRPKLVNSDELPYPDAGAFVVEGMPVDDRATVPPGAPDDGYLWFMPLIEGAAGAHFAHLRGNVAEYVVTNAAAGLPQSAAAKAASDYVRAHQADLAVMGGSALSPPELDPNKAAPVVGSEAMGGWADVGFRLAFSASGTTAPKKPKAELLAALLGAPNADPYLLKR